MACDYLQCRASCRGVGPPGIDGDVVFSGIIGGSSTSTIGGRLTCPNFSGKTIHVFELKEVINIYNKWLIE